MEVVYIDEVFALNALVDYLLLLCAAKLAGEPFRRLRFALAALAGGLYAAGAVLPGWGFLTHPLYKLAAAVGMLLLRRAKRFSFYRFCGLGPGFWAGSLAAGLVLLVGGLAALDFDRAFVIFHALFFPGKDNWIFDPAADQIILIMPEVFFRNCALRIGGVLLLLCAALVLSGLPLRRSGSV